MKSKVFALVALVVLALVGGQSAHAKSAAPLVQFVYIEMDVQGLPTTGCSSNRAGLPFEIWFQVETGPTYRYTGNTDSCGFIYLTYIPSGDYMYYYVKGVSWLSPSGLYYAPLCGAKCTGYIYDPDVDYAGDSAGNDWCGWSYGDNNITISDFNSMKAAFGRICGDLGYNSRDDFNNNCYVNIVDANLLNQNFGTFGTNCTTCGCSALVWKPDLKKTNLEKKDLEMTKKWTAMAIPVTEKISKTDLDSK